MNTLIIKRSKDFMDSALPFYFYINEEKYKIWVNKKQSFDLNKTSFFQVQHPWLRYIRSEKIALPDGYDVSISVRPPLQNNFMLFFVACMIFTILSWQIEALDWLRSLIVYGIGISFMGLTLFFLSFGSNHFFKIEIQYKENKSLLNTSAFQS